MLLCKDIINLFGFFAGSLKGSACASVKKNAAISIIKYRNMILQLMKETISRYEIKSHTPQPPRGAINKNPPSGGKGGYN